MTDPLGLIGITTPLAPNPVRPGAGGATDGPGFKELLKQQIAEVNEMQRDAKEATEDIVTGRRDDVEAVILATKKADTAFHMLLQVRNRMMEAYDEVKQIRI
ncbi:MAG: flagellar hook-basal body complex protein FliE [Phycisphaerales bacterium]|nr:flagellar hook-basal body complex protein FliE [Phycisphaerae bacterium]NNF44751.1 flagellar hook-basal body complex protein FliE [Phycisphaerales bacterium]NNM26957.1 flagellar hook-basal body complex protein FliE [Phycisphaerales bacterium]